VKIEYESELELDLLCPVIPCQHCPAVLSYGDT